MSWTKSRGSRPLSPSSWALWRLRRADLGWGGAHLNVQLAELNDRAVGASRGSDLVTARANDSSQVLRSSSYVLCTELSRKKN